MSEQKIPVNVLNENLRSIGRSLDGADIHGVAWEGDELGLQVEWPDGFTAWLGFGELATAAIESTHERKH